MWSAWIVALPPLRPRLILFFLRERPTLGLAARQDVRRQRQDPPEIRRPHRYRAAIQPPTPPPDADMHGKIIAVVGVLKADGWTDGRVSCISRISRI